MVSKDFTLMVLDLCDIVSNVGRSYADRISDRLFLENERKSKKL